MKRLFQLSLLCLLLGCSPKEQSGGPLSKINQFQVYVFFSPYKEYNQDELFKRLMQKLETIGTVETGSGGEASLLVSFADQVESIVVSDVAVPKSGFETGCSIWSSGLRSSAQSSPRMIKGKVELSDDSKRSEDPFTALDSALTAFTEQYRQDNPNGNDLIFFLELEAGAEGKAG